MVLLSEITLNLSQQIFNLTCKIFLSIHLLIEKWKIGVQERESLYIGVSDWLVCFIIVFLDHSILTLTFPVLITLMTPLLL